MARIKALEHEMVPDHEVMDDKEVQELLNKLNIKKEQLPKIFENDPALKDRDAKIGDVIKITRDSPTAGKSTYYRLVIEKD
ncbi:MAG: DNA-directed RNA polymerase subunit H [Candidatus Aenigmatarchaeota archaeon]